MKNEGKYVLDCIQETIEYVIVNGSVVIEKGEHTGKLFEIHIMLS